MSTRPMTGASDSAPCWCCGYADHPDRMVKLGNHTEVHLCLRCAHFVHQRARQIEDEGKSGPVVFARDRLRNLRTEVARRDLQHNRLIGGTLRWLGRHLP